MGKYVDIVESLVDKDDFVERVERHVTIKLRSCPFCGKKAHMQTEDDPENIGEELFSVECEGCKIHSGEHPDYESAAQAWNIRTDTENMTHGKLKRCPFCGGRAELDVGDFEAADDPMTFFCQCTQCEASTTQYLKKEAPVKAWNKRKTQGR